MNRTRSFTLLALLSATLLVLESCSGDDPFVKPKLTVSSTITTVKESDGVIQVEVTLDRAYSEDITIEYSLGGTAKEKVAVSGTPSPGYDYEITSEYLELEILKGETTGTVEITLASDFIFEDPETIEIQIEDVSNDNIEITNVDEVEITIEQEDGMMVVLTWGLDAGENYTDVDMDLFLWATFNSTLGITNITSIRVDYDPPEFFFLPTALLDDGEYGLSCNYYEGTADPMNFDVSLIEIIDGNDVFTTELEGTYTLANINKWTDNEPEDNYNLVMVQTFEKSGTDFLNFSPINEPSTGSRIKTGSMPGGSMPIGLTRQTGPQSLPNIIKPLMH